MFSRNRTPFSSMTKMEYQYLFLQVVTTMNVLCETVWISVVDLTGSSGKSRPLESIRWEAKMVLINVDFPRPV